MAVATPILERKTEEKEERTDTYGYTSRMTEDELHNSKISDIYARLINPESKLSDFKPAEVRDVPVQEATPAQNYFAQQAPDEQVYLVENARADADIFRADSAINRRVDEAAVQAEPVMQSADCEEENEDLLPSRTTMQYSSEAKKSTEEGTISNRGAAKRISLSKRDKIIIAVVVSVIIALFVLIIVNSAIISSVNSDLDSLQGSLSTARSSYESVLDDVTEYEANFDETLKALAENYGMVR